MNTISLHVLQPAGASGPEFTGVAAKHWRDLAELSGRVHEQAEPIERRLTLHPGADISRRDAMKVMSAALAWSHAAGCDSRRPEHIVPQAHRDARSASTVSQSFATAVTRNGFAMGVLAESYSGRPIKLEGNPDHPASLGATDSFTQAEVLTLYDPDRSQAVHGQAGISTWDKFHRALAAATEPLRRSGGEGLRLLTGNITSPTQLDLIGGLLMDLPESRWHIHEPVGEENAAAGAEIAFGGTARCVYHFDLAQVVLAMDSDFLFQPSGAVRYAFDFMDARRPRQESRASRPMNRLYVAEPSPTVTGSRADHRLPMARVRIPRLLAELAHRLGLTLTIPRNPGAELREHERAFAASAASDLLGHRERGIVLVGEGQPAYVHALVHAINDRVGSFGKTISLVPPAGPDFPPPQSLGQLAQDMAAGAVQALLIVDTNPAYTAPADLQFARCMADVPFCVHMGLYRDETARLSHWHLPLSHTLESWGDARSFDGAATVIQPLIAPLYESRTAVQLLRSILGERILEDREVVRRYWRTRYDREDFESWWRETLRRGVVAKCPGEPETSLPAAGKSVEPRSTEASTNTAVQMERVRAAVESAAASSDASKDYEVIFAPDQTIWDGRYANNAWLQELPKPISKLTWDNPALISPAVARAFGLRNGDIIELAVADRAMTAAVWIMPGQADATVTVTLGYGRTAAGSIGNGTGFDAYTLRTSHSLWQARGLQIRNMHFRYPLAETQGHHDMHNRELVRHTAWQDFLAQPPTLGDSHEHQSLFPAFEREGERQWGMVIDLTTCIGCNACTIACQAENNIPVVGKKEVLVGREMHWIRVDTYFEGPQHDPAIHHQPVPCMHCESAPCEIVCPVAATTHSHDGLNEMTYNRCVGTRYCSNNCPYKVRRFNFYAYQGDLQPVEQLRQNPDVTVRGRGVMEKCTYCVQRIRGTEITAKREGRPLHDGEVMTACQQVCPTRAIVFGDLAQSASAVRIARNQPHNYALLAELNTRPRTTYLADVRNPHPAGGQVSS